MKKIIILVFALLITFFIHCHPTVNAYGFGFKKNQMHEIPDIGFYKSIIEDNNGYYVGNPENVYLTFDVGYDNGYLEKYLDVLKSENVKATFFVTGDFVERFSSLLVRIYEEGHLICNHSYGHKCINTLNEDQLKEELEKLELAYYKKIGVKMPKIFRPPEGQFDEKSMKNMKKLGYKTVFWSIAHVDWKKSNDSSFDNVANNLHDGAIILLHTVNEDNYKNLPKIIEFIREKGYEFSTVDKIL